MKRILVIDDDEQVRKSIQHLLEREGYEIIVAENGKVGLSIFNNKQVDLVITDIVMPEKEGIEVLREMKKNTPEAKIIVISGGGSVEPEGYLKVAKMLGADFTLGKPFKKEDLLDAVQSLIGASSEM